MNNARTINMNFKGDKTQEDRVRKLMKSLGWDSPCWILYISFYLGLSEFERIFRNCNNEEDKFKKIIHNPENWNFGTARIYYDYVRILDLLPEDVKQKFFIFLQEQKLRKMKGGKEDEQN